MKLHIKEIIILYSMLVLTACGTCNQKLISHSEQGLNSADVNFRYCGYASGYSVAVYATKAGPLGTGEASKEVFKTLYKRVENPENNLQTKSPVNIEWKSDNHLVIYHKTRMSMDDEPDKPMIYKAVKMYQGVHIEYVPEPVFWD